MHAWYIMYGIISIHNIPDVRMIISLYVMEITLLAGIVNGFHQAQNWVLNIW